METPAPSSRCHRYPAEIIAHCLRLSSRFRLCQDWAHRVAKRCVVRVSCR